MSKDIALSDEVYRRLKREKGDRSFSEIVAERLDESARITDVTGQRVLDAEVYEDVNSEIRRLSAGTEQQLDSETS